MTQGWHGKLQLTYDYNAPQTRITHQYAQAPFKIQSPFYPEDPSICHSVILHTAGGMVGGDRLSQTLSLHPNANALVTTAAATKIYGHHPQPSQQEIALNLAENSVLEWFPQENIIFNNSIYKQSLKVNLAPNTTLFVWEINRFGRTARGEQFKQGNWRSQTDIFRGKHPLWIDRQALTGGRMIEAANGLGGFSVVGSFICLGKPVSSENIQQIRQLWSQGNYEGEAGVTQSLGDGIICRYRGHSTTEVRQWFVQVWHFLRQVYLQRPSIYPRVWLI
ncbi:MAG: urease accessory protein UreD [Microcystaceae cyanobacterium]